MSCTIGAGAGKFLGVRRIFARKVFVRLLPAIFLPQGSWKPFYRIAFNKKILHVFFCKRWARLFQKTNNVGHHFCPDFQRFCTNFQGFCPDFRQIKIFWGAHTPPAPPPPTSLSLTISIIRLKLPVSKFCALWPILATVQAISSCMSTWIKIQSHSMRKVLVFFWKNVLPQKRFGSSHFSSRI